MPITDFIGTFADQYFHERLRLTNVSPQWTSGCARHFCGTIQWSWQREGPALQWWVRRCDALKL